MFPVPLKCSPATPDISPIKKVCIAIVEDFFSRKLGSAMATKFTQMKICSGVFFPFERYFIYYELTCWQECCKQPSGESSLTAIKRYYAHLVLLKKRIDLTTHRLVEWPWYALLPLEPEFQMICYFFVIFVFVYFFYTSGRMPSIKNNSYARKSAMKKLPFYTVQEPLILFLAEQSPVLMKW